MIRFGPDKAVENKIDRLAERLEHRHDNLDERMDSLELKAAENNGHLKEHMRRTEHLETLVEQGQVKHMASDKKIDNHISKIDGGLKVVGYLALVLGIAATIMKIVN